MNVDDELVKNLIETYFTGLHHGDSNKLAVIFHKDCVLKSPDLRRDLADWLQHVTNRQTPAQRGDDFAYEILSIDRLGEQAMAKVLCPLLGDTFIDYLGLLKENNQWLIVNKMYAKRPEIN